MAYRIFVYLTSSTFRIAVPILFLLALVTLGASHAQAQEDADGGDLQENEPVVYLPIVSNSDVQPPELEPIIPDTTKLLTETSNQYLQEISDEGVFTFSQSTSELSQLEPGDVIVSSVSSAAPFGYLRRVEQITPANGQVIIETSFANLEDAVQQGSISISEQLAPPTAHSSPWLAGANRAALFGPDAAAGTFVIPFSEEFATNVGISGSTSMDVSYDFDLRIKDSELQLLRLVTTTTETADLNVDIGGESTFGEEKKIADYDLGTRVYTVGWVPVVVGLELEFYVGANGSVTAKVATNIKQQFTAKAGAQYAGGSWSPISSAGNDVSYGEPQVSGEAAVKAYVRGELELELYGIDAFTLSAEPGLKLSAGGPDCWKLDVVLDAKAWVELRSLVMSLPGMKWTYWKMHRTRLRNRIPAMRARWRLKRSKPKSRSSMCLLGICGSLGRYDCGYGHQF